MESPCVYINKYVDDDSARVNCEKGLITEIKVQIPILYTAMG